MRESVDELKNLSASSALIKSVFLLVVTVSAVIAGGCLDSMQVPVIGVLLEVGLDDAGDPVILEMDATPMMINTLKAPKSSSTRNISGSVSAFAVHNLKNIGYWDAVGYTGPGSYELTLAFPSGVEVKANDTIVVEARIADEAGNRVAVERQHITWESS